MAIGTTLLLIAAALIFFGAAQRLLDRLRLTDSQALVLIALMIGGSFITIPLTRGPTSISVNLGGAVVPLGITAYLLLTADTSTERWRAIIASVITAGIVYGISQLTDFDPSSPMLIIDPLWLFSLIAGLVGYVVAGRSRRAAFVAGILGIFLVDLLHLFRAVLAGMNTRIVLGGAGVLDGMVVAGFIAIGLAEFVGEIRERVEGGEGEL